ncbi:MAG: DNA alkylation repair protein [Lachnospiraceae bacterium]|nr:DNA alkylation repair protein [Lachnospiraceae bacterium]
MWYFEMFERLEKEANPEAAIKMAAYMKNKFPFLGIATPKRVEIIKSYIKKAALYEPDWDFVYICWDKEYREAQYIGNEYLSSVKKKLKPEDVEKIRELIIKKPWWDITDGLDRIIGDIALRYPEVNKTMLSWSKDKNIWLRRVSIDFQLLRKENTDTKLLEEIIVNNFGTNEFFINKAIGWALRDYSKINPEWVRAFVSKHKNSMSKLSLKEASKYI